MRLADCRLTVVGLGLMGGSLAAALKDRTQAIVGVDRNPAAGQRALDMGIVDRLSPNLEAALAACDIAVLAVPVRASLELIARLGRDLPAPPRLMDLGSTKLRVVRAMRQLPESVDPIGGHPLCGREIGGPGSGDSDLYRGERFALVPLERTSPELKSLAEELVRACGAAPLYIGAEEHDRAVALASHVPYLLAAALVGRVETWRQEGRALLASGFHDTSRLAASDVTMMIDILTTNREPILKELEAMEAELARLRADLAAGREEELRARLDEIRRAKRSLKPREEGPYASDRLRSGG